MSVHMKASQSLRLALFLTHMIFAGMGSSFPSVTSTESGYFDLPRRFLFWACSLPNWYRLPGSWISRSGCVHHWYKIKKELKQFNKYVKVFYGETYIINVSHRNHNDDLIKGIQWALTVYSLDVLRDNKMTIQIDKSVQNAFEPFKNELLRMPLFQ